MILLAYIFCIAKPDHLGLWMRYEAIYVDIHKSKNIRMFDKKD
jgi:hypothetical protein